jgi:hypothetical protein
LDVTPPPMLGADNASIVDPIRSRLRSTGASKN